MLMGAAGGASGITPVSDMGATWRYLDLHDALPEGLALWSDDRIRELARNLEGTTSRPVWEETLILIAHHQSQLARDLLEGLGDRVPGEVRGFYELACAESEMWLDETPWWAAGGRGYN